LTHSRVSGGLYHALLSSCAFGCTASGKGANDSLLAAR
jgi:hypothetical protein